MIRIFIGYDPAETVAYHVLSHSLMENSSYPISITPVNLSNMAYIYDRPRGDKDSTEFSISRFMVPLLCDYKGWAIFMDCDFLCLEDIADLWAQRDDNYDVMCVKHVHDPPEDVKFLDNVQTKYKRKNWSSLMMFNNSRCRQLTRDYVHGANGLSLHQFDWCRDIGDIDKRWNYLVGYYPYKEDVSMVHYTTGGPYFHEYRHCDYADKWFEAKARSLHAAQTEVRVVGDSKYRGNSKESVPEMREGIPAGYSDARQVV